jgi:hypothetical protein
VTAHIEHLLHQRTLNSFAPIERPENSFGAAQNAATQNTFFPPELTVECDWKGTVGWLEKDLPGNQPLTHCSKVDCQNGRDKRLSDPRRRHCAPFPA